uniref:Uncharacterized protein AlNc14C1G92 n=1 Tax=Albugo laibachii Nc14 TaxID=890382 RepID=F0VYU1_9STRA|nr:conserved hypothetical protein [Albugo laibachii Nc14]|eukprot:CCA13956.1 conserved hypothetical protein [Albugo laibachii Nc14]
MYEKINRSVHQQEGVTHGETPSTTQLSRTRKRHKHGNDPVMMRLESVRREIEMVKGQYSPCALQALEAHCKVSDTQDHLCFLKNKLTDHQVWMQTLYNIFAIAPLANVPLKHHSSNKYVTADQCYNDLDNNDDEASEDSANDSEFSDYQDSEILDLVSRWQQTCDKNDAIPNGFIRKDIDAAATECYLHGLELLNVLKEQQSSIDAYPDHTMAQSRGWKISVVANDDHNALTFYSYREIRNITAEQAALEIWEFTQKEELLRAFLPVIQETTPVYSPTQVALTRRILLMQANISIPKPLITIESIRECSETSRPGQWVISMGSLDNCYLRAFALSRSTPEPISASSTASTAAIPVTASPSSVNAAGVASDINKRNSLSPDAFHSLLLVARMTQHEEERSTVISIELGGCVQQHKDGITLDHVDSPPQSSQAGTKLPLDFQSDTDSEAQQLTHFLATLLPVFEELHLSNNS